MSTSRIYRLLKLITLLQQRRSYTASELAQELEVSKRTVFRDLNVMEMAQIPYYFDPDSGGYRISGDFFLPPVNLTVGEALAMLVLSGRLRDSGSVPLMSEGARAAMKVESALPEAIRSHVGKILRNLSMRIGPVARHESLDSLFDQLARAVADRRVCRLTYISFYEQKQLRLTVHPVRLMFIGRAWYLLAHSRAHKTLRTLKLSRIRRLAVQKETFPPVTDCRIRKHFGNAWCMIPEGREYDVHLRFEAKVAGNVAEVRWHPTQQVQWRDDGSIDYRVRVDGLGEITWWILGYGDQVEAVDPPELRRRIAQIARGVARRHAQKRSRS